MDLIAVAAISASVLCAVLSLRPRHSVAARLASVATAEALPRSGVVQRLFLPAGRASSGLLRLLFPSNLGRHLAHRLEEAGQRMRPGTFLLLTLAGGLGLPAWMAVATLRAGMPASTSLLFIVVGALFGSMAPSLWLRGRATRRQMAVERALPDFLDLVIVSVEAGLGFEGAVARIVDHAEGPLSAEFRRVLADQNLGASRRQALQALHRRCPAPGVSALVAAMLQAEQTGMGIGQVLRAQGERLRVRRRQRAEEAAMKAPLKMLFPLVFFIFPSLFVVVLGPAMITVLRSMGGR